MLLFHSPRTLHYPSAWTKFLGDQRCRTVWEVIKEMDKVKEQPSLLFFLAHPSGEKKHGPFFLCQFKNYLCTKTTLFSCGTNFKSTYHQVLDNGWQKEPHSILVSLFFWCNVFWPILIYRKYQLSENILLEEKRPPLDMWFVNLNQQ